ncbi:MAG: tRNA (adenosine(37)-N6)-threonylcarbamoyltransferase complex transferase subunit TsaD [Oscillospiraceae bacterium]|nr:tRNA (adenosine(37)-N6)-threonylcarbamoyltransferase complex transferase subunit TsaD [Oscillospiraceae bacterium]
MLILAVESSCDETAVAVVRDGREALSDSIASQTDVHSLYGGVVPELASRRHAECIHALAEKAVREAGISAGGIDAVACTAAPGLIGSLLVGLGFAKAAAFGLGVPLIPVHHIRGHVAACYITFPALEPPFAALVASGGHSSLLEVRGYTQYRTLGATRDDAAGECFDKAARAAGLGYPGGPVFDRLSQNGDPSRYHMPSAKLSGNPLDMSFSGLKTHVVNLISNAAQRGEQLDLQGLAASFSQAVCRELVSRLLAAMRTTGLSKCVLAGGVAANSWLRKYAAAALSEASAADGVDYELFAPPIPLCGDNASMIGAQGYYEFLAGHTAGLSHNARASCPADDELC